MTIVTYEITLDRRNIIKRLERRNTKGDLAQALAPIVEYALAAQDAGREYPECLDKALQLVL